MTPISCIDPMNGAVVRTVEMPALNITSMCWGGPAYDVMYVTTARHDTPLEVLKAKPLAGAVFEITGLGCKGTPPFLATIDGDIVNKIKRDA
ncbi:hypothetical protein HAZT_HAZT011364 [Hyalella azteca]|uniref:SMP-30/Gluconolactonase/LRE-like region domain-containing protein n=1 Tax=Hyalella azteca TaxID=294128 RepID=A0A6A0H695_HYAAZ|nr:hypothetical protein HAZT_HAZT011364 [Hyalella azteca]